LLPETPCTAIIIQILIESTHGGYLEKLSQYPIKRD
jgi:hypothetical protein